MSDIECPHCGNIAYTSRNYDPSANDGEGGYLFAEDDGEACASCGISGHVSLDVEPGYEGEVDAWWSIPDDALCKDPLCEECTDARLDLHNITPRRAKAVDAVRAIVADLTDRRGLKREWHAIENEIQWQIVETWIGYVEACTGPQVSDATKAEGPER